MINKITPSSNKAIFDRLSLIDFKILKGLSMGLSQADITKKYKIPKSTLSERITVIKKKMGFELFIDDTRQLTESFVRTIPHIDQLLNAAENVKSIKKSYHDPLMYDERVVLHLGISAVGLISSIVYDSISRLFPLAQIVINATSAPLDFNLLYTNDCIGSIHFALKVKKEENLHLVTNQLIEVRRIFAVREDHPLTKLRRKITEDDVLKYEFGLLCDSSSPHSFEDFDLVKWLRSKGADINEKCRFFTNIHGLLIHRAKKEDLILISTDSVTHANGLISLQLDWYGSVFVSEQISDVLFTHANTELSSAFAAKTSAAISEALIKAMNDGDLTYTHGQ